MSSARTSRTHLVGSFDDGDLEFLLPTLGVRAVASRPRHLAVVDASTTLDYHTLRARADALGRLQVAGVRPGDRFGLCQDRSVELVVALLGIARAGAEFVPLDTAHPTSRLQYVVDDADIRVIVVDASTRESAVALGRPMIETYAQGGEGVPSKPQPVAGPEDLAYVIYTSGSTGMPKGVAVSHRALANWWRAWPGIRASIPATDSSP